jgi:hypothetical protein
MPLQAGDVFQLKGFENHARVVVTSPDTKGKVLIFGLTDSANIEDRVCLFQKGDHPFVRFETAVAYRWANVMRADAFQEDSVRMLPRMGAEHLLKIIESAFKSEDIEPKFLDLLPKPGPQALKFIAGAYQP